MALRIQVKGQPDRYVVVGAKAITIGRDPANDLVVDGASVSDFHAEVMRQGQEICIEDLLSQTGTFVNGEKIAGLKPLEAWDVIRVGTTEIELNDPSIARRAQWMLEVRLGERVEQRLALGGSAVIGRDPACDVVLTGELISRRHTSLEVDQNHVEVTDLNSMNGTLLNGRRVSHAEAFHFDELEIEPYTIVLLQAGVAAPSPELSNRTVVKNANLTEPREDATEVLSILGSAARLVERTGILGDATIALSGGPYRVGRAADNDIVIADPSVSKSHARLEYAAGAWHIEDLASSNGVLINQSRVQSSLLADGDVIGLGRCELEFRDG